MPKDFPSPDLADPASTGIRAALLRVLVLGGSSEATALAVALADQGAGVHPILSLAGRTVAPAVLPVETRIGGFGGIDGLAAYLSDRAIDVLVDATHPFAAQISRHAREASRRTGRPLIAVARSPWIAQPGDRWTEVADMAAAAAAIGPAPRRVFLTVGRLQLAVFAAAPQHHYLVRTVDAPSRDHGLAQAQFIRARGPFAVEEEERLMRQHRIDCLVSKNSGGTAAAAKLEAARRLGVPVILVRRPDGSASAALGIDEALSAILAHGAALRRGV